MTEGKKKIVLETLSVDEIEDIERGYFTLLVHTPFSEYCFKNRRSVQDVASYIRLVQKFGFVFFSVQEKEIHVLEEETIGKEKQVITILNIIFQEILQRRDLITKQRTIDLLGLNNPEFELKTRTNALIPNKLMGFQVSDQYLEITDVHIGELVAVTLNNPSHLQKFGKLWNLIEPELNGQLTIYQLHEGQDQFFEQIYQKQYAYKLNAIIRRDNEYIVGTCQGTFIFYQILLYQNKFTIQEGQIVQVITTPIYQMRLYNNEIYIITDQQIKIYSNTLIGGGSLKKRLDKAYITCMHFQDDILYVGSSAGSTLMYKRTENLEFIGEVQFMGHEKVISLSRSKEHLFPATRRLIPVINSKRQETCMFQSPLDLVKFIYLKDCFIGVAKNGTLIQWDGAGKLIQGFHVCDAIVGALVEDDKIYLWGSNCMLHIVELIADYQGQ